LVVIAAKPAEMPNAHLAGVLIPEQNIDRAIAVEVRNTLNVGFLTLA
jgi:hypothetical protein